MPDYSLDPIASNLGKFIRNRDIFRPEEELVGGDRRFYTTAELPDIVNVKTQQESTPNISKQESSTFDVDKAIKANYSPNYEMQDRLRRHLDEMPTKEKPSFLRKVVASMAGAGGDLNKAEFVMNSPYYTGMADWKSKADILSSLAMNESRMNRDEANFALQEISRQLQAQRLQLDIQKNEQIYTVELAKLQQQIQAADDRLKLAYDQLTFKAGDANAQLQFKQAQLDALNARHAADLAQRDAQLANLAAHRDALQRQADERNRIYGQDVTQRVLPTTTREELEVDESGEPVAKVRTTTRGRSNLPGGNVQSGTVPMIWKDGKTYQIPVDKVEQARKDGFRHPGPKDRR